MDFRNTNIYVLFKKVYMLVVITLKQMIAKNCDYAAWITRKIYIKLKNFRKLSNNRDTVCWKCLKIINRKTNDGTTYLFYYRICLRKFTNNCKHRFDVHSLFIPKTLKSEWNEFSFNLKFIFTANNR